MSKIKIKLPVVSKRLVSGFDAFWAITLEQWKNTPLKERNFLKRIGLEPNKETSYEAYIALKCTPPQQFDLFPNTSAHTCSSVS